MSGWMALAGTLEDVDRLSGDADKILKSSVTSLLCTLFIIVTGVKTKRVGATFVAAIAGAAIWFVIMNMTVFRDKVGEDLNSAAPVVIVQAPGSERDAARGAVGWSL